MPVFIIILGGILLMLSLAFFMWIDLIIIAFLLFSKWYGVVLVGIPLIILVRMLLYYNVDIFAWDCENFADNHSISHYITDEKYIEEMFAVTGSPHEWPKSQITRNYAYTLLWAPHDCHNQSTTLYSPNKRYKVTIHHSKWQYYFLFQKNEFIATWERLD